MAKFLFLSGFRFLAAFLAGGALDLVQRVAQQTAGVDLGVWGNLVTQAPILTAFVFFSLQLIKMQKEERQVMMSAHAQERKDLADKQAAERKELAANWQAFFDEQNQRWKKTIAAAKERNGVIEESQARSLAVLSSAVNTYNGELGSVNRRIAQHTAIALANLQARITDGEPANIKELVDLLSPTP